MTCSICIHIYTYMCTGSFCTVAGDVGLSEGLYLVWGASDPFRPNTAIETSRSVYRPLNMKENT